MAIIKYFGAFFFAMSTALFIGRFQPLHNGHVYDIQKILKSHRQIIIAVGSSQESGTCKNPMSYDRRKEMIECVMAQFSIRAYTICPLPDFFNDEQWTGYIKKKIPHFETAYSGNPIVLSCLTSHGITAKKLPLLKGITATDIRKKIVQGKPWEHLVPAAVTAYLKTHTLIKQIQNAHR